MQEIYRGCKAVVLLATLATSAAITAPVLAEAAATAGSAVGAEQGSLGQAERLRMQALSEQAFGPQASADPAGSAAAIDTLISDPAFPRVPQDIRIAIYSHAGHLALETKDHGRARDLYLQAITANSADSDDWSNLSWAEYQLREYDAAAAHMAELARRWPGALDGLHDSFLFGLIHALDAKPARMDLLQSLASSGWKQATLDADYLWFELALLRVQRGEHELARAAIDRIAAPRELIELRSDRRFDGLFDPQSPRFDVVQQARQRVGRLSTLSAAAPLDLELASGLADALQVLGDSGRVVTLVDATLRQDAKAFVHPEFRVWLLNAKSSALDQMGRWDDAVATMRLASALAEEGATNVSQSINLANMECARGNGKRALAALKGVVDVSDYGRMAVESVRHCALLERRDRAGADRAMAYLQAHRDLSTAVYVDALMREERMDDAAAALVEALDSEDERSATLVMVQDYLPRRSPPATQFLDDRWQGLMERADVGAAIDRVGRRRRYGIRQP